LDKRIGDLLSTSEDDDSERRVADSVANDSLATGRILANTADLSIREEGPVILAYTAVLSKIGVSEGCVVFKRR
jgi:hypothetical protein